MTALNKTDSRLGALREVAEGAISYDARTGTYSDTQGTVSGARRRTFAELRTSGAITSASDGDGLVLTPSGETLIEEWVD
jgi:hypothetical protein